MPVVTLYTHGVTSGCPPQKKSTNKPEKRDITQGWTFKTTRSNTKFLYGVDETELSGDGFCLSLTVRDCPLTSDDWAKTRDKLLKRFARLGMIRIHWLTEWQKRGVPHLHCAVWFDNAPPHIVALIRQAWLDVASEYTPLSCAQHIELIKNELHWFKYLAKHASRGAGHYQRSKDSIPDGWIKTGRMWGYRGDWPKPVVMDFEICMQGWHAYRRIIKNLRLADARAEKHIKTRKARIKSAKKMYSNSNQNLSTVRGFSEWSEQLDQITILNHLYSRGFHIT